MHAAGSRGTDPPPRLRTGLERLGRGVDDVKNLTLKQSIYIAGLAFIFLWICLYVFSPILVGGRPAKIPRARSDEKQLVLSSDFYKQEFGSYPAGENSNIIRALGGDNPKEIVFLNVRRTVKHPNEMVDPWETPCQIEFYQQTNCAVHSPGKDKIFGNADDIIFNSVSNDFVKP